MASAPGDPPDEETVIACFRDEFGKAKIEEAAQRDLYEKDGCEQLRRFLRSDLAQPTGEILNNERFFRAAIGGAVVKGRMDRLERIDGDRVSIIDYKTGKPKTQDVADESLQLSIYALAAKSIGFVADSLVIVNLTNCTSIDRGARRSSSLMKPPGSARPRATLPPATSIRNLIGTVAFARTETFVPPRKI